MELLTTVLRGYESRCLCDARQIASTQSRVRDGAW